MKNIISIWKEISKVIQDEMSINEEFAKKMEAILIPEVSAPKVGKTAKSTAKKKKSNRNPAKINPIELWEEGEEKLREELAKLEVAELKDVIAEYGWNTKGVLNYKKREKLEPVILDGAKRTATRGNAFWDV